MIEVRRRVARGRHADGRVGPCAPRVTSPRASRGWEPSQGSRAPPPTRGQGVTRDACCRSRAGSLPSELTGFAVVHRRQGPRFSVPLPVSEEVLFSGTLGRGVRRALWQEWDRSVGSIAPDLVAARMKKSPFHGTGFECRGRAWPSPSCVAGPTTRSAALSPPHESQSVHLPSRSRASSRARRRRIRRRARA